MFERFTDKARRAVVLCQEEASRYNHNSIGTDHLLLALTFEGTVAHQVLVCLGADFEQLRADVVAATGEGLKRRRPRRARHHPRRGPRAGRPPHRGSLPWRSTGPLRAG